jgi:hypothetical protein
MEAMAQTIQPVMLLTFLKLIRFPGFKKTGKPKGNLPIGKGEKDWLIG